MFKERDRERGIERFVYVCIAVASLLELLLLLLCLQALQAIYGELSVRLHGEAGGDAGRTKLELDFKPEEDDSPQTTRVSRKGALGRDSGQGGIQIGWGYQLGTIEDSPKTLDKASTEILNKADKYQTKPN